VFSGLAEESTSPSGGPELVLDEQENARLALVFSDLPRSADGEAVAAAVALVLLQAHFAREPEGSPTGEGGGKPS
jgi:hypothetical protein